MATHPYKSLALQIASDANYSAQSDAFDGSALKVAPTLGQLTQGVRPNRQQAAQSRNWVDHEFASVLSALIANVTQIQALNFPVRVSGTSGTFNYVFYNKATREFYYAGDTERVFASSDLGVTWDASSQVAAVGSNENCLHGDADDAGNVVVGTATRYVFQKTASSGTWTKQDAAAASITASRVRVFYDAVHAKWILSYHDGSVHKMRSSTDRTTWNAVSAAPTFTNTPELYDVALKKSTGLLLAVYANSSTNLQTHRSTDGGASWTMTNVPRSSGGQVVELSYAPDSDLWVLSAFTGDTNQIWTSSDDGETWTLVGGLSTPLTKIACLGELWLALAFDPGNSTVSTVYSTDRGTSWRYSGLAHLPLTSGRTHTYAVGGGFAVVTSDRLFLGSRVLVPDSAPLS